MNFVVCKKNHLHLATRAKQFVHPGRRPQEPEGCGTGVGTGPERSLSGLWGRVGTGRGVQISRAVLRAENASPCVCRMFYKATATVQAVLLYGSETWNLTPSAIKNLEGFNIRSAYWMAMDNTDPLTKEWT